MNLKELSASPDNSEFGEVYLSIVSPVFRAEAIVAQLVQEVHAEASALGQHFEIILVDDRSPDLSWEKILESADQYPEVLGIRLSRNFGQHYAISAGLQAARGRWVVVMDCDLQDSPREIGRLVSKAEEGFDVVLARRSNRQDSLYRRSVSRLFYGVLAYLTGTPQDPAVANFGVYGQNVVEAINGMPETIRYLPTMVRWVGFSSTSIDVVHGHRHSGKSAYNFRRMANLAIDICLANSDKPLRLVVSIGFVVSAIGFVFAAVVIYRALYGRIEVLGYASLIVSVWVLLGLTITIMGVVGLYVGKCFEGVKRRPPFVIDRRVAQSVTKKRE